MEYNAVSLGFYIICFQTKADILVLNEQKRLHKLSFLLSHTQLESKTKQKSTLLRQADITISQQMENKKKLLIQMSLCKPKYFLSYLKTDLQLLVK